MPGGFRPELARRFLGLAAATALAGLIGTGTVLVVRTAVSRYLGLDALGFFSVAWTVSMTYVTLVLGSFGTYYLPTLAAIAEPAERNALIRRFLRFGIIASTPLVVAVIVAKPLLVSLLYTDAFLETLATMRWMLVGDYLKITAWVLAMPIVAYARARAFTWSEILTHAGFLAFSVPALRFTGQGEWVGVGFMLMYVGYLAFTATYVRKVHGFPFERATILPWLGGLAIVAAASAATWTARTMSWPLAIGFVAAAVAFSWVALTPWEREELGRIVSQRLGRTAPT
jgi:PST family polysaccharide transporter